MAAVEETSAGLLGDDFGVSGPGVFFLDAAPSAGGFGVCFLRAVGFPFAGLVLDGFALALGFVFFGVAFADFFFGPDLPAAGVAFFF